MKKRYIILSLLLSLTLIGCSKSQESNPPLAYNTNVNSNSSIIEDLNFLPLSNNCIYPSPFNITNNSLVFPNWDDNNKISFIKTTLSKNSLNTSDVETFINFYANSVVAQGDNIYFGDLSKNGNLSFYNIVDKSYEVLNSHNIYNLTYNKNNLYYINLQDNRLYTHDILNKSTSKLIDYSVGFYLINGDYILFENKTDNSNLYSYDLSTKKTNKISSFSVNSFGVLNDNIYAINSEDNNNLYSINLETFKSTRVAIINGENLKSFNDTLFFINLDKGRALTSITLEENTNNLNYSSIISSGVNDYFPTTKGLFYQSAFNVNNTYVIKNDSE